MKWILLALFVVSASFAQAPNLNVPTQAQMEDILADFAGNMVHSTATGAHSATLVSFEIGVVGGVIDTPNLALQDPNVDKIGNGALYATLELPLGIGGEMLYSPVKTDDLDYDYKSFAAFWSVPGLSFSLKLKGFATNATIKFIEPSSSANVNYESSGYGANITFGKKLLFVEPYLGVGYVSSNNKLTTSVAGSISGVGTVEASAAAGLDLDDTYIFAGLDVDLIFLSLGFEYSKPYGNDRYIGRVALGF